MELEMDATGAVVLVTGGARGVGLGIAESFATRGAQVIVCGRSDPSGLPDGLHFLQCNVRDIDAVNTLLNTIATTYGSLDVVVNNAGGSPPGFTDEVSPRFSAAVIDLNLTAPLYVARQANEIMQRQPGGGSIINIASVNALRPSPGNAAYGAAKAGLLSLTESLAAEWAPLVRVNAVTAGVVRSDELLRTYYADDPDRVRAFEQEIPMGRMADPTDVGNACVFLSSAQARHITGANLVVHGGGEPTSTLPVRATERTDTSPPATTRTIHP